MTTSYMLGFLLQGIYFVLVARALGSAEYGIFVGALSLVSVFASMAGLGSGNVLVLMTARDADRYRVQLGTALVYIALTFVPLTGLATVFALVVAPSVALALIPLLISELLFTRAYDLGLQSFQAHDQLKGVAHLNVAAATVRVALAAAFLASGASGAIVWSWLYAFASTAVAVAILAVCFRRFGAPRWDLDSLRSTWRTGIFFALGMSSRILLNDSDKIVLAGSGRESEAGQYGAASRIVNMAFSPLQAITYSLNTTLFRAGREGYTAVWAILRRVLPISVGYVLVAGLALWLVAPLTIVILGSDYSLLAQMLPLLSFVLLGQAGAYYFGDALMGLGKQNIRSIAQASVGAAVLVSNLVITPIYGWVAAALIAITASWCLTIILMTVFFTGLTRERRQTS